MILFRNYFYFFLYTQTELICEKPVRHELDFYFRWTIVR